MLLNLEALYIERVLIIIVSRYIFTYHYNFTKKVVEQ